MPPSADILPSLLDDRVEHYWNQFLERCAEQNLRVPQDVEFLRVLRRIWAYSEFVAQNCSRDPALLLELLSSGDLLGDYRPDEYSAKLQSLLAGLEDEQKLAMVLRRFRRREMLRIAWRDLAGWASLDAVLAETSALAAACIDGALGVLHAELCAEYGTPYDQNGKPQALVVIALGKLGGWELNFSSDVDLLFAYPEDGKTRGKRRRITNEEFFLRLGRRLIRALDARTEEGLVFRVDMRLRPFGDSGPLVLSFAALEEYYQIHGRSWERYALTKARVVAGERDAGSRLLMSLRPFVYRRYVDFGALQSLRDMKRLIAKETQRKGLADHIKLGPGGIREVEFVCQAYQLIRGGRQAPLQTRGTLTQLQRIASYGYLPQAVTVELEAAYRFLRKVENCLQEAADEQTHALPADTDGRLRLSLAMGFIGWDDFLSALNGHRDRVETCFARVFNVQQETAPEFFSSDALHDLWQGSLEEAEACALLEGIGFNEPAEAWRRVSGLRTSHRYQALSNIGQERMDRLMPMLLSAVGQYAQSTAGTVGCAGATVTLARVLDILEVISWRINYLALLVENPQALAQLVVLCAASPWIAALLARHPSLLDELLDPRTLYIPLGNDRLLNDLWQTLLRSSRDDLEQQMEALRHLKQVSVLHVAATDVMGTLPLMVVSDQLTAIAEIILRQVLNMAWEAMLIRHGKPCFVDEQGATQEAGFAIVGYGKLGGIELGYGSDLDLVFLHDGRGEQRRTTGPKRLDNEVFFARLVQRIVHILNAHTPGGVLYEVDIRLRPDGASGLLVSSLEGYADYERGQAWTWEHQALVRARVVAEIGPHASPEDGQSLAARFSAVRAEILSRKRDPDQLQAQIREMRDKMRSELDKSGQGWFDLKQGRGGIVDIEFMVQYAVLLNAHKRLELLAWTDNIRLLESFAKAGLMAGPDRQILSDAYRAYRAAVHRCALQDEAARVPETEFQDYRAAVMRIWRELFEKSDK